MDEKYVFDRFHEALELEPNEGAYERFRSTFVNPKAVAKRRSLFRMRFTKMSFRLAAVMVAVAVIAIAVVAGILAHRGTTSYLNATQNKNVQRYQALVLRDYESMNNSTSNHCGTITDQGCAAAVARVVTALHQWGTDLAAFPTPPMYKVLDGQLQAHLTQAAADLNAAVAFQKLNNVAGFNLAMSGALFERGWFDPASFELEGQYDLVATSYRAAMTTAKHEIDGCVNGSLPDTSGCQHLSGGLSPSGGEACGPSQAAACEADIQSAQGQMQDRLIEITQFAPPANDAAKNALYEVRLSEADNDLIAMTQALLQGDSAKFNASELAYAGALSGAKIYVDSLATT